MNTSSIIELLNKELKLKPHESWDNSGLQIGSEKGYISKIMLTLDLDLEAAQIAVSQNVNLIITHHPFFFSSIKKIDLDTYDGQITKMLITNNINLYSMHTNYDMAEKGVNYNLARKLNIKDYQVLHPVNIDKSGYGGIGTILPVKIREYAEWVKKSIDADYLKLYCTDENKIIKKVAFCGGSGSEFIKDAINLGADLYITGDIKYHQAQEAIKNNLCLIDAGHYNTEVHSIEILKEVLEQRGIETIFFKKNMTSEKLI